MVKPKMTKVSSSYKYASKQTGAVLDKLIEAQLSKTKKQTKMTEKFLFKMKLAVQKKISMLSRDAFAATPVSAKSLRAEVAALRKELQDKSRDIKATAADMLKESKATLVPKPAAVIEAPVSFDGRVAGLSKTFDLIATSLSGIRDEMKTRVEELSATLAEAEKQWGATAKTVEGRSSAAGNAGGRSKDVAPARALAAHLSGR